MGRIRKFFLFLIILFLSVPLAFPSPARAAITSLSSLAEFTGESNSDYFSNSVSSAGDFNNDGYDDVIIGAYYYDSGAKKGRAYIFFGSSSLTDLSASNADVILTGESDNDRFGHLVPSIGDFNNDGYDDVIVGAYGYDSGTYKGRVYLFLGSSSPQDTAATDADAIFTGESDWEFFGTSISSAGDVNNDGHDDVIIGASSYNSSQGRAYLFLGSSSPQDTAAADADAILTGVTGSDQFGSSVSSAGDINNDGYDDVAVGTPRYDSGAYKGRTYLFLGSSSPQDTAAADADVILTGESNSDFFGHRISPAGDTNNDGYGDIIVSAYGYDSGGNRGRAYIFLGSSSPQSADAADADVIFTGESDSDRFSWPVSSAGDVNNDGYDDVLVGAWRYDSAGDKGRAYIFLGSSSPQSADAADADVIFTGESNSDRFSISVSSVGDFNNDGWKEVVIGAYYHSAGAKKGKAYVYNLDYGSAAISVNDTTHTTDPTPEITGTASFTGVNVSGVEWSTGTSYTGTWTACTASDGSFDSASESFSCTIQGSDLADGEYTIYFRSYDVNSIYIPSTEFASDTFTVDTASPTASSVSSTPTSSGATITWTTNENASSQVEYGLTTSYGSSTSETDTSPRVSSHSVSLSSLAGCATYHYRVKSSDAAGNEVTGTDNSFTASGCTGNTSVSSQTASDITIASGGSLNLLSDSKGMTVTVPASFSSSDANFQIKQLDKTAVIGTTGYPSGGNTPIGSYIYDLVALSDVSTTISSFDQSITISVAYSTSEINNVPTSTLKLYRWDGSDWNQLSNISVDATNNTVSGTTTAFSTFALFGNISSTPDPSAAGPASPPSCGDTPPGPKIPWLYGAIAQGPTSIKLYFTQADGPVDKYVLVYGTDKNNLAHGSDNIGNQDTRTYTVNLLVPNTTYFFKVRGQNGCAPGDWSNILSAKTKTLGSVFGRDQLKTEIIEQEIISEEEQKPEEQVEGVEEIKKAEKTYTVRVKVVDTQSNPVKGAKVILASEPQERMTDQEGIALFDQVEPGQHTITIAYQGYEGEQTVNLQGDVKGFDFTIKVDKTNPFLNPWVISVIGILFLIIAGFLFWVWQKR